MSLMVAGFESQLSRRRATNPEGLRLSARGLSGYPSLWIQVFHLFCEVIVSTGISSSGRFDGIVSLLKQIATPERTFGLKIARLSSAPFRMTDRFFGGIAVESC